MQPSHRTIAVLGAGPIGLEAALYARARGYTVRVYERGDIGEHVRRWSFVRLFSPWSLNVSTLGLEALRAGGHEAPNPDQCPTGAEFVQAYLEPLAASLAPHIERNTEVLAVSRRGLLKADNPGGRRRARSPFRLLVETAGGEREDPADFVVDATGVYSMPADLGDGGIPALGERGLRGEIDYHPRDVLDRDRERFSGHTVLVVGSGYSAATTLAALRALQQDAPATRVVWVRRSSGPDPFPVYSPDPLPERSRLGLEGNRIAAEPPQGFTVLSGVAILSLQKEGSRIRVDLRAVDGGGMPQAVVVDRIIANVGYRPDTNLFRELQIHQCYASEGPMALAAALLGSGSGGDCLAQPSHGPEVLKNPEPGFYVVGAKSYGRRNDFLLRSGREQVRDVFQLMEDDPSLDLYSLAPEATAPRPSDEDA